MTAASTTRSAVVGANPDDDNPVALPSSPIESKIDLPGGKVNGCVGTHQQDSDASDHDYDGVAESLQGTSLPTVRLLDLQEDALCHVLSFLSPADLCRADGTCRKLRELGGTAWDLLVSRTLSPTDLKGLGRVIFETYKREERDSYTEINFVEDSGQLRPSKRLVFRWNKARTFAQYHEWIALLHFDYDTCIERPDYVIRCAGCQALPDLHRLQNDDSDRFRFFVRLSLRMTRNDLKRVTGKEGLDAGLLWEGFVPSIFGMNGFIGQLFFGSMLPSKDDVKAGITPNWKQIYQNLKEEDERKQQHGNTEETMETITPLRDADENKFLFDLSRRGRLLLTLVAVDVVTAQPSLVLATGGNEDHTICHPGSIYLRERCTQSHARDPYKYVLAIMHERGGYAGGFSFAVHYPKVPAQQPPP